MSYIPILNIVVDYLDRKVASIFRTTYDDQTHLVTADSWFSAIPTKLTAVSEFRGGLPLEQRSFVINYFTSKYGSPTRS